MEHTVLMTEQMTEQSLLAACRDGSREAFESLFLAHQKRVFSIALNFFGGDHSLAGDVTQQVFLKLFRKIGDFRAEAQFVTWLYRLTVNACIDERRRRRRFFSLGNLFGEACARRSPDEKAAEREIASEVQRALADLKPKFRLPILLRYVEGLSYEEIAEILDCSSGTVASRLSRGHKLLAGKLKHLKGKI
jgi:RNA polymerase sigma-70 factor, ECF subfamily